jgi:hypothetical protein
VQCPVEAGPYKVTQTVELPREIPHGMSQTSFSTFDPERPCVVRMQADNLSQVRCVCPRLLGGRRGSGLPQPLCRFRESAFLRSNGVSTLPTVAGQIVWPPYGEAGYGFNLIGQMKSRG